MSVRFYLFNLSLYLVYVQNLKKLHLSTLSTFQPFNSLITGSRIASSVVYISMSRMNGM